MTLQIILASVLAVLLLCAGCHQGSALDAADLPVIVHLESRQHTITAKASPIGPLYTVTDRRGNVLAADLTLDQLHASHPDLYRKINGGYATDAPNLMWIDASADRLGAD